MLIGSSATCVNGLLNSIGCASHPSRQWPGSATSGNHAPCRPSLRRRKRQQSPQICLAFHIARPSWIWAADDKQAAKAQFEHRFQLEGEPTAGAAAFSPAMTRARSRSTAGRRSRKSRFGWSRRSFGSTNLKAGENHLESLRHQRWPEPGWLIVQPRGARGR